MKKLEGSELSFSLSVVVVKLCVSSYCYWEASGGASLTACAHTYRKACEGISKYLCPCCFSGSFFALKCEFTPKFEFSSVL